MLVVVLKWELCIRRIPYEGKTGLQVSVDVVQEKRRPEVGFKVNYIMQRSSKIDLKIMYAELLKI